MKIIGEELERVTHFKYLATSRPYRRGMLCENGDHSANGTTVEKLEEMQEKYRVQKDAYETDQTSNDAWGRNVGYNEETRTLD